MWLLQNKRLWLARVDTLDDEWELALTGDQLAHVLTRHPISPIGEERETGMEFATRVNKLWRSMAYVNCWCQSPYESHALWRIYCGPTEGVALQTTLGKLKSNVGQLSVEPVSYGELGLKKSTPELIELALKKRPMFEYEHEVRVIGMKGINDPTLITGEFGFECRFDPNAALDAIFVHPMADMAFKDTVVRAVMDYAPALRNTTAWSAMKDRPPLLTEPR